MMFLRKSSNVTQVLLRRCRVPARTAITFAPPPVDKPVGYWLLGCGGLVAGMVSVGGLTRLTRSGLSMTDWKLQGSLPPATKEDWEAEFERYKQFPEWEQRKSMSLDEFKTIYWWEYGHRMFGRVVGVAFCAPLVYFGMQGRLRGLEPRLAALLGLGATQGLVGWWMVRSGLDESARASPREIRVSPYRLATHLGLAFSTYSLLVWTSLDVLSPARPTAIPTALKPLAVASATLVFATALSGAFVAGNDAGRAFNTFPKMDGHWVPPDLLALSPVYRNFGENAATVQFDHRLLALASTCAVGALALAPKPASLPPAFTLASTAAGGLLLAQVSLGVATLLLYVPVPLAATHQLGSLALLTATLCAAHALKATPGAYKITASALALALPLSALTGLALDLPASLPGGEHFWLGGC
ncbi:hypothetical protein CTAYLR_004702 [Chrysophaeum taylorii]|uniref:Uncharacterized protein n=1 Tax=Chrysophaeum taylorii TaxID=2483200 RepID=A0AAD7U9P4_9STRA|nr:hypothetical protein CTAYLR_004702 [Chrysophaeum taylorii]